jgi:hypothetical protein
LLEIMTEQDISKSEKKIKLLTERVGCSEEGRLWLEQALDPFTDTPKRPVGFPDLITGKSIVQVVKQNIVFKSMGAGTDIHVFLDNVDSEHTLYNNTVYAEAAQQRGNFWNASAIPGVATGYKRGGLRIRSSSLTTNIRLPMNTTQAGVALPDIYAANGRTRVIAKGFEVHNVTPILNLGGSITVYRDSTTGGYAPSGAGTVAKFTNPASSWSLPLYPCATVPETLSEVLLIPGAKTWEAKDGCYCVATMNEQNNSPGEEGPVLLLAEDTQANRTLGTGWLNAVDGTVMPRLSDYNGNFPKNLLRSPFFVSGAWLAGVSAETVLSINVVYIVERFVDQTNPDLVVLSSPSPYLDVVAQELYAKAAHRLRAGVPVNDNDTGDWIKSIADLLGDFGVPGMPLVKGGVDLYNKLSGIDSKTDKNKNEHKKEISELKNQMLEMQRLLSQHPMMQKTLQTTPVAKPMLLKSAPKKISSTNTPKK